jgi:lysyl-tRNA synthetase class 2
MVLKRVMGKASFATLQDGSGKIQIYVSNDITGEAAHAAFKPWDLGDILGVDGKLAYTKTGELTIFAEKLHFLTKSIAPPPDKHAGLADPELRQRMRYLDLAYSDGVLDRFRSRTKVVQSIRSTLNKQGFCEIEGPTLHTIAGGAAPTSRHRASPRSTQPPTR